jgi:hypothetical protein
MIGMKLGSISGKADITLIAVDKEKIIVEAKDSSGAPKKVERKTRELRGLAKRMKPNKPIHVDASLKGGGSSRNQPETILANLPDVEWTRVKGRKHILWVVKDSHKMGTLHKHD